MVLVPTYLNSALTELTCTRLHWLTLYRLPLKSLWPSLFSSWEDWKQSKSQEDEKLLLFLEIKRLENVQDPKVSTIPGDFIEDVRIVHTKSKAGESVSIFFHLG